MVKNLPLTCPKCRSVNRATTIAELPISHTTETFVKRVKDLQIKPAATSTKPHQVRPKTTNKELWSTSPEHKCRISSLINDCEEKLSQLVKYGETLKDWTTEHLQLQDRLKEQNQAAIDLLKQETTIVVDMTTEGEDGKRQLEAMLGSLDTVNSEQSSTKIDDVNHCSMDTEVWIQKCQKVFPDASTVHTSVKVKNTISEALERMTTVPGATAVPYWEDSTLTIMEKVKDLGRPGIRRVVEAGRVSAVLEDQVGRRYCKITRRDGRLYLHTLRPTPAHTPLPTPTYTIKHSTVMDALDSSSTLVFLDLGWKGSTKGRVHIRLRPDTPLGRQFTLLCTGQNGHTFAGTNMLVVGFKGKSQEFVAGGDYEFNDGRGGVSLLPDLQDEYQVSDRAGAVGSRWGPGRRDRGAQFVITTRDRSDGEKYSSIFG
ncbi:hypothetical protein Hamer_G017171, partial [Homarus americanus]